MSLSFIRCLRSAPALGLCAGGLMIMGGTISTVSTARAQAPGEIADSDTSPYHRAILAYKAGKFQDAYDYLDHARDSIAPEDVEKVAILKSKILADLQRYDDGEKVLRPLVTSTASVELQTAMGDLLLRKRAFDRATKYFTLALKAKANDPDLTLKLVYARIGASDLVGASQYASQLTPLDPKNPYDAHASYYFAKAALAQATGQASDAEAQIQEARTIYGITVTNRYLKTYLEFFAAADKGSANELTPPPRVKDKTTPTK